MTTPLGRVRGLGSASRGTAEHVAKQFSGFILLLLTPWVLYTVIRLAGRPYGEVVEALRSLWVSPPLAAFIVISVFHMRIGMKVVIEDYVHSDHLKTVALALNWIFAWTLAILSVFALLRIFTM
jgi:succinate dehydrogenase / fumarate reductase membrane anchor subunit